MMVKQSNHKGNGDQPNWDDGEHVEVMELCDPVPAFIRLCTILFITNMLTEGQKMLIKQ